MGVDRQAYPEEPEPEREKGMEHGALGDPATPYAWAEELAAQPETVVLLAYEGAGHTVYGYGDPCVDGAVDAYLSAGEVPEAGLPCPGG